MGLGHILVARQGMADEDGVRPLAVERAVGLVGDGKRAELDTGIEPHRPVRAEGHAVIRRVGPGSGGAFR
jgi:hypothetical protein